jgi:YVTN family beta-propeller protein
MSVNLQSQGDIAISGDVVGRDKIINNIQNIVQRALTAAEEAQTDRSLEAQELAKGVSALAQRLQARAADQTATRGNPYKGLLTYQLRDAGLFFGRSRAIRAMLDNLSQGSFTVLHSESGAGKSSLIQAGVMPRLIGAGHLPVYLRPYQAEPDLAIKRAFLSDPGVAPLLATAPLRDFLTQVTSVLGEKCRLYIFLDQFEELFTQQPEAARAEFVTQLADCLDDSALNARWVLAMRTEYFGNLASFRPRIRNPFANDLRLDRMTRDEAREAVVEPAKQRAVVYEDGLVDQMLSELSETGEIAPPELQIVCAALYDELPERQTVEVATISRALYDGQGGALGILRDHLSRVLTRDIPIDRQVMARRLMEALISSEGRRIIRSRSNVLSELAPLGVESVLFDSLVNQLVDSRLLRVLEPNAEHPEPGYELMHDYLVGQITVDPAVQARKAAQEILEQETENYKRYGTLLNDDKLAILAPREKELALTPDSKALLEKSQAAMRRRRGVLVGGSVLALLLLIVGIGSAIAALTANANLAAANSAAGTARVEATQASFAKFESDIEAAGAAAAQGTSAAVADIFNERRATAVAAVNQAATQAADIQRQAAAAKRVVQGLYEINRLIPVEVGPSAMTAAGDHLWVASAISNSIQPIDPASGAAGTPITVGRNPSALLFDGQRLWVANTEDGTVQAFDPLTFTEVITPIRVGRAPLGLAFDGRRVWVTNSDDDTVSVIDPQTREAVKVIDVGNRPYALVYDGQKMWVTNWSDGTVQSVNPDSLEPEDVVPVGSSRSARPVAILYDGARLWVVNQNERTAQVQAVDPIQRQVVNAGQPITVGNNPVAVAYNATNQQVWVSVQGEDAIRAVDATTFGVGAVVKVGRLPYGIVYAKDRIWVANNGNNTVQVVSPRLGDLSDTIAVGQGPRDLLFDEQSQRLWIAHQDDKTVQALSLATRQLVQRYGVGNEPRSLAFDGARLWVVNGDDDTVQSVNLATNVINAGVKVGPSARAVAFDGVRIWVINGRGGANGTGTIQPINVESRTAGAAISIGRNPVAIFFDGLRLWVANGDDGTVQSIAPTSNQVGDPIKVGNFPNALAYDGRHLWVANQNSNTVQAIDPLRSEVVVTVTVSTAPIDLAYDGTDGLMWVASFGTKSIQSINVSTFEVGEPIPVDSRPRALAFDGQRLWIANQDSNTLQFLTLRK